LLKYLLKETREVATLIDKKSRQKLPDIKILINIAQSLKIIVHHHPCKMDEGTESISQFLIL
jgi:hypothetical protein